MPKKLTTKQIKDLFSKYGYIVPDGFVYTNNKQKIRVYDEQNDVYENMNVQQLKYRTTRAATIRQPYFDPNIMNININDNVDVRSNDSFDRWCSQRNEEFNDLDDEYKHSAFNYYRDVMPIIAQKQNTTLNFDQNENVIPQVYGLIEALKTINYGKYDIRLTITDINNSISYAHANENTINFLFNSFYDYQDVGDSSEILLNNICDVKNIHLDFIEKTNAGVQAPGFFPFINKSELDLTMYGIYNDEKDIKNESCLLTAIRSSGLLNENQLELLHSMLRTRNVMKTDLRKISDEFKFNVHVRTIKDDGKDSHYEIINNNNYPLLKLVVVNNHFMLNKTMTAFNKKLSIQTIVKKLSEQNLLEPISDEKIMNLVNEFKSMNEKDIETNYRLINVKNPVIKNNPYRRDVKQTKRFFGYEPDNDEIDERLNELQKAINTLPLRNKINVKDYYRFSELGQKILYETGCYDGVYEMTGNKAVELRNSLVFPKTKITGGEKTFYSNEKLYYLDINAAYMNFVKFIPSGLDDGFVNYKVGDVIKQMYDLRMKAKREGKEKLAKTIKFIMNSTWGYSISKPKVIKNKYVQNVDFYSKKYNRFVLKINGHFVSTVNSFVPHYVSPQFAKSVLDEYNKFFNYIKSIIPVFYENIDAILTNEEGYKKLNELNLIGDDMGRFKVDKIFKEIAIISNRVYVGTTENNERIYHCTKKPYEDIVNIAKNE